MELIQEELNLSLKRNGMYSIAPFVGQIISKNVLSILADRMKREKWMSNTATVKLFQSIGNSPSPLLPITLINHRISGYCCYSNLSCHYSFMS